LFVILLFVAWAVMPLIIQQLYVILLFVANNIQLLYYQWHDSPCYKQ
jgi:hypothetical protein